MADRVLLSAGRCGSGVAAGADAAAAPAERARPAAARPGPLRGGMEARPEDYHWGKSRPIVGRRVVCGRATETVGATARVSGRGPLK